MSETLWKGEGENALRIDTADIDGVHLVESDHKDRGYIYISEIEELIGGLKLISTRNEGVPL